VADWNPFYWAATGMRALFAGYAGDPSVWKALVITAALTAVAVVWPARLFARSLR
jgi:ABC-2 type transport system permease protein